MSFLSIVKSVFTGIEKVGAVEPIILPAITAIDPSFASIAALTSTVTGYVIQAERLFTTAKSGADKKAFVLSMVSASMPLLLAALGSAGKTIDPAKFQSAVGQFVDSIVAALNAAASVADATTGVTKAA